MIDYSFSLIELEYFLLILVRVSCFIYVAPFFSLPNLPQQVKIGLSVFISFLLYYAIFPKQYVEYSTVFGFATIVVKEATTGIIIGLGAQLCTSVSAFVGNIVDMEIGLKMLSQLDPTTQEQSSISGIFYQYFVTLILLISGFYQYLIRALAETFILIPLNGAIFRFDSLIDNLIMLTTNIAIIGFKVAMPIFASIIVLNTVLGILAKVASQLNMFSVGIQLKLLVGLSIFFLTIPLLPTVASMIFEQMKIIIVAFVNSMM
ncbi:MAG: flagellar biosynthetic protein FliR [Eubacteriales bacterium]